MKTSDGNAMAVIYDGNEFDEIVTSFDEAGKTIYKDIMNEFVKETIKSGGSISLTRHKGGKIVAK